MLSKRFRTARTILATLALGCSLPWAGEGADEINVSFQLEKNQILVSATLDDREGEFIVGSAQPRSVLDPDFKLEPNRNHRLVLGRRFSTSISPVVEDLGGVVDGIVGADAWRNSTLIIDYARQLVIISRKAADPMDGQVHRFDGAPAVPITIDGKRSQAIVDTALPDTLVIPGNGREGRGSVKLKLAEHELGSVDAGFGNTSEIRIGNRLLSRFLVKIDYRRSIISLWRDPRRA